MLNTHMCVHMYVFVGMHAWKTWTSEGHMYNKQMFLVFCKKFMLLFSYSHKFQDRSVHSTVLNFLFNMAICSVRRHRHFILSIHFYRFIVTKQKKN